MRRVADWANLLSLLRTAAAGALWKIVVYFSSGTVIGMASKYSNCPECRALNLIHRNTCYRCGRGLIVAPVLFGDSSQRVLEDRRMAPRFEVNETGAVIGLHGDLRHKIHIKNISIGGLMFESDSMYRPGKCITLRVCLDRRSYVVATVVKHQTGSTTGVEFIDPPENFILHIASLSRRST